MAETEDPAPPDDGDDPRTASATPTTWPARSPPRDHHRPAEAPEHQRGGDTRRRHQSGADPERRRHTMDRPGPAGPCPPPRGRPHGQARAAQVKEAATAKRPRREMLSPPMPASKPPCVATARSWPTAPVGAGRTQCDSLCAAPGPVACRRLGPVYQPGASPLRSRAVTGPAGQAPARWPHVRAAKAIRAVSWRMVEAMSTIVRRRPE